MKATFSPTLNLTAYYYVKTKSPSAVQLRTEIDDANPLYLRAGNPNLKPEKIHTLDVQCNKILARQSSALETVVSLSLFLDPIVSGSRYFTEKTYLPEYDYTVERGAMLDTYENTDAGYHLLVKIGYEKFWPFLGKCKFTPGYKRKVEPFFTQDDKNDLTTDEGRFDVRIYTNFSKKVDLTIFSGTRFTCSDSRLGKADEFLSEKIILDAKTKIIPKFFVHVSMTYDYTKNFTTRNKTNETILNASISRNFGKNLSLLLNGENLLDSKRSNIIGQTSEYDYRSGRNLTGRYVTMQLSYKF